MMMMMIEYDSFAQVLERLAKKKNIYINSILRLYEDIWLTRINTRLVCFKRCFLYVEKVISTCERCTFR